MTRIKIGFACAAPLLLGACAMTTAQDDVRLPGDTTSEMPADQAGGFGCDAEAADALVGQKATQELGTRALALTGAKMLRWIAPNSSMTMDIREDRLNVYYDANYQVQKITCG